MAGFDIPEASATIREVVLSRFRKGRVLLLAELSSPGYEEVIKSIDINEDMSNIKITFQEGIDIAQQDFFEVLAQGGTIAKRKAGEDEYISIKPSAIVRKYLGKR